MSSRGGFSSLRGNREPVQRCFDLGEKICVIEQVNHLIE